MWQSPKSNFLSHSFLSIDTKSLRHKAWFCLESIYCLPSLTGTQLYVGSCEIHLADIFNITQLYQYLNSNIFPVEQATIFHPLCENLRLSVLSLDVHSSLAPNFSFDSCFPSRTSLSIYYSFIHHLNTPSNLSKYNTPISWPSFW